jgi:transcriptional/translational regulatory protein YebC/TACO1
MFQRKGVILVEKDTAPPEDRMLELALAAGAEDLNDSESHWEIVTDPSAFRRVRQALEAADVKPASAELTMQPTVTVPLDGGQARSVLALVEALEDNDDVQAVHANFDIPEDVMAEVG